MNACEMWPGSRVAVDAIQGSYSLQAKHPITGDVIVENYASLKSAVSRTSKLVQAGYSAEIWSPLPFRRR